VTSRPLRKILLAAPFPPPSLLSLVASPSYPSPPHNQSPVPCWLRRGKKIGALILSNPIVTQELHVLILIEIFPTPLPRSAALRNCGCCGALNTALEVWGSSDNPRSAASDETEDSRPARAGLDSLPPLIALAAVGVTQCRRTGPVARHSVPHRRPHSSVLTPFDRRPPPPPTTSSTPDTSLFRAHNYQVMTSSPTGRCPIVSHYV